MNQQVNPNYQYCIDVPRAFNDYIFKDGSDITDLLSSEEECIYHQVTSALETSSKLSAYVPALPRQLAAFLDEIAKEETDFDKICQIVESDISLTGETIRIANSPLYRRSAGPIESLGKAIAMLGLDGVNLIATSLMMKQVLKVESPDLRQIGDVLWAHCLDCAEACRSLNTSNDQFTTYLLGLVHDVGAVAIFSCYVSHLGAAGSKDGVNHFKVLKLLMEEQATWLSAHIAREWKLPEPIITALYDFDTMRQTELLDCDKNSKSELAQLLEQGNAASEVYTLIRQSIIEFESGQNTLFNLGLSEEDVESIFNRFDTLRAAGPH